MQMVRIPLKTCGFFVLLWSMAGVASFGQDTGAMSNGNWNDPTIWTGGSVPSSSSNVYIGSTYPTGGDATATVTLTQAQFADNVYMGDGSGSSGTLNLGNSLLTITNTLYFGKNAGGGTIVEGTNGSFTAQTVHVDSQNSLTFGAHDVAKNLTLYSMSSTPSAGPTSRAASSTTPAARSSCPGTRPSAARSTSRIPAPLST